MSSIKYITLEEEMEKNSSLKMSDIEILREWCKSQPHLPKIEDVQIAIFLHSNYYDIELTKKKIENYYTYRTHMPEFFSNRDLIKHQLLRDAYKVAAMLHLEDKTKEGYNIIMGRLIDTDPSQFFFHEVVNASFMIYEQFLWTHGSTRGCICIVDAAGAQIGHLFRVQLKLYKNYARYVRNALPIRLKAIHVINISSLVQITFNMIIKPILGTDILKLMHFHSNLQSANDYFPIKALPNEFGGEAGAIQELMDEQMEKIEMFREWYLEDETINRVNESLRIDKSNISSDKSKTELEQTGIDKNN